MVQNKINLSRYFHIAPSEIELMPYWEFELIIKTANENIERENEEKNKENGSYSQRKFQNPKLPKLPSYPQPKMPKF